MLTPPSIPDHEMISVIGQGSYGQVWRARSTLGTMRAVKVVWRANFESARPYEREFMGIKRFEPVSRSHEGLVDILQVGRNDEVGCFYYVMELADNAAPVESAEERYLPRTLRSEIDSRGRIPAADCVDHFLSLAAALGHMHRLGLLHRDVKPSNIILVEGVAKLADIGLVAEMREGGSFVGTEGYIPPEGPNSAQADLYSLGKTLYEAATGMDRMKFPTLPTTGPDGLAALSGIMDLNAVSMRACMPLPEDRYQSGAEMLVDLATIQSGRSVREVRRSAERLQFARRWGLVAGGLSVLAAAIGGFAVWRAGVEQESRRSTEQLLRRATEAEAESSKRLHGQSVALARAECLSDLSGRRFRALDAIREAARLRPEDVELRSQAITALAIPDFIETKRWPAIKSEQGTPRYQCMAPRLDKYAQAQADGSVLILPIDGGKELMRLPSQSPSPEVLTFSPNGKYLLTWALNRGGDAVIWEATTGREALRLPSFMMIAAHGFLRFRDSPAEVVILQDNTVVVFPLEGDTSSVRRISLPSRKDCLTQIKADRVLAGSRTSGRAYLVNLATNAVENTLPQFLSSFSFGLSDDAKQAAVSSDGTVTLHFPAGDHPPLPLPGRQGAISTMEFDLKGEVLLTSSWDGASRLFGCADQTLLARHLRGFAEIQFHPQNKLSILESNYDLVLADWAGRDSCRAFRMPPSKLGSTACFAAKGKLVLSAGTGGTLVTEASTLRSLRLLESAPVRGFAMPLEKGPLWVATTAGLHRSEVTWASDAEPSFGPLQSILPGDAWGVAEDRDGAVIAAMVDFQLYVSKNGGEFVHWGRADAQFRSMVVSPDGRWLLTRGEALLVMDLTKSPEAGPAHQWTGAGFSIAAFTADSRSLVISSAQGVRCEALLPQAPAWHYAGRSAGGVAASSPDGKLIAAADSSSSFLLLRPSDGSLIARVEHHLGTVVGELAFSPEGSRLLVTETNDIARIWDLATLRKELALLQLDWKDTPP